MMTKTKAQLRAEAVERLKRSEYHTALDDVCSMLGWGHEPHFEGATDALVDLLTDDCDTECYACAKLAELRAENNALRVKVDEMERADVSQAVEDTAERVTKTGEMLHDSREKLNKLIVELDRLEITLDLSDMTLGEFEQEREKLLDGFMHAIVATLGSDALRLACQHVAEATGSCPYDVHHLECASWEDGCEGRCSANVDMAACWQRYFNARAVSA